MKSLHDRNEVYANLLQLLQWKCSSHTHSYNNDQMSSMAAGGNAAPGHANDAGAGDVSDIVFQMNWWLRRAARGVGEQVRGGGL